MAKRDLHPDSAEPAAGAEVAPVVANTPAAANAPETINLRWTPAPGNMTTTRIIDDYTWTPGAIKPVALAWWQQHEVALRTSPRETFELVAGAAAQQ